MTRSVLLIEKRGPVDWITLNRPDAFNSLNEELGDALNLYFKRLARDYSTRVVVLRGAGRNFCAGLDVKSNVPDANDQSGGNTQDLLDFQRGFAQIFVKMRRCPQPIITLVHGAACGGGFALALASDIRIAASDARMNCAFIKLGVGGCDMGSSYFLPRLVGGSVAAELILTGRFIHAHRALAVGLVSEVVDRTALESAAQPYIDDLLATAPLALRLSKECLNMSIDASSIEQVIAMEDRNQILCIKSADFHEGVSAFREKRRPAWTLPEQRPSSTT